MFILPFFIHKQKNILIHFHVFIEIKVYETLDRVFISLIIRDGFRFDKLLQFALFPVIVKLDGILDFVVENVLVEAFRVEREQQGDWLRILSQSYERFQVLLRLPIVQQEHKLLFVQCTDVVRMTHELFYIFYVVFWLEKYHNCHFFSKQSLEYFLTHFFNKSSRIYCHKLIQVFKTKFFFHVKFLVSPVLINKSIMLFL